MSRADLVDRLLPGTIANAATIPHYAARWNEIDWTGIRCLGDLARLPVLTRAEYQEHLDDFDRPGTSRLDALPSWTSGTTGQPLVRYRLEEERRFFDQLIQRVGEMRPTAGAPAGASQQRWLTTANEEEAHGNTFTIPVSGELVTQRLVTAEELEAFIALLLDGQTTGSPVTHLWVNGHQVKHLTAAMLERGISPASLSVTAICMAGAYLSAPARHRLMHEWPGTRLVERWSMSEILGGATLCTTCGWHHFDPFIAAEVVDLVTHEPIVSGEGVLVVTELYPFVRFHPFIRYWSGDVVRVSEQSCDPGAPSIRYLGRMIEGRPPPLPDWASLPRSPAERILVSDVDGPPGCLMATVEGRPVVLIRAAPLVDRLDERPDVARFLLPGCGTPDPPELHPARCALSQDEGDPQSVRVIVFVPYDTRANRTGADELAAWVRAVVLEQNADLAHLISAGTARLAVDVLSTPQ